MIGELPQSLDPAVPITFIMKVEPAVKVLQSLGKHLTGDIFLQGCTCNAMITLKYFRSVELSHDENSQF